MRKRSSADGAPVEPEDLDKPAPAGQRLRGQLNVIQATVRRYPSIVIVPVLVLAVCVGLGVFGVMQGMDIMEERRKSDARELASTTLTAFQLTVQQAYTTVAAVGVYIQQNSHWPTFNASFTTMVDQLLDVSYQNNKLVQVEVAPNGVLSAVYPDHIGGVPTDILSCCMEDAMREVQAGVLKVDGPYTLQQNNTRALIASLPVFISSNVSGGAPDPAWGLPASNGTCSVPECYNQTTKLKWWGTVYSLLFVKELVIDKATKLPGLKEQGWWFVLRRTAVNWNQTSLDPVLVSVGGKLNDPVVTSIVVGGTTYELLLAPCNGWNSNWWPAVITSVIVLSIILATLVFFTMMGKRQKAWLLYSILPRQVVQTLRRGGQWSRRSDCCVLFADVVGFTHITSTMLPEDIATMVGQLFRIYEDLTAQHGLTKVDIVGDCFIAAAGMMADETPEMCAVKTARLALDMVSCTEGLMTRDGSDVQIRIGVHAGPVVSVVVGVQSPKLTVFGDVVNTCSRLQSTSLPSCVQVSSIVAERLVAAGVEAKGMVLVERGEVELKNRGVLTTWWVRRGQCPTGEQSFITQHSQLLSCEEGLQNSSTVDLVPWMSNPSLCTVDGPIAEPDRGRTSTSMHPDEAALVAAAAAAAGIPFVGPRRTMSDAATLVAAAAAAAQSTAGGDTPALTTSVSVTGAAVVGHGGAWEPWQQRSTSTPGAGGQGGGGGGGGGGNGSHTGMLRGRYSGPVAPLSHAKGSFDTDMDFVNLTTPSQQMIMMMHNLVAGGVRSRPESATGRSRTSTMTSWACTPNCLSPRPSAPMPGGGSDKGSTSTGPNQPGMNANGLESPPQDRSFTQSRLATSVSYQRLSNTQLQPPLVQQPVTASSTSMPRLASASGSASGTAANGLDGPWVAPAYAAGHPQLDTAGGLPTDPPLDRSRQLANIPETSFPTAPTAPTAQVPYPLDTGDPPSSCAVPGLGHHARTQSLEGSVLVSTVRDTSGRVPSTNGATGSGNSLHFGLVYPLATSPWGAGGSSMSVVMDGVCPSAQSGASTVSGRGYPAITTFTGGSFEYQPQSSPQSSCVLVANSASGIPIAMPAVMGSHVRSSTTTGTAAAAAANGPPSPRGSQGGTTWMVLHQTPNTPGLTPVGASPFVDLQLAERRSAHANASTAIGRSPQASHGQGIVLGPRAVHWNSRPSVFGARETALGHDSIGTSAPGSLPPRDTLPTNSTIANAAIGSLDTAMSAFDGFSSTLDVDSMSMMADEHLSMPMYRLSPAATQLAATVQRSTPGNHTSLDGSLGAERRMQDDPAVVARHHNMLVLGGPSLGDMSSGGRGGLTSSPSRPYASMGTYTSGMSTYIQEQPVMGTSDATQGSQGWLPGRSTNGVPSPNSRARAPSDSMRATTSGAGPRRNAPKQNVSMGQLATFLKLPASMLGQNNRFARASQDMPGGGGTGSGSVGGPGSSNGGAAGAGSGSTGTLQNAQHLTFFSTGDYDIMRDERGNERVSTQSAQSTHNARGLQSSLAPASSQQQPASAISVQSGTSGTVTSTKAKSKAKKQPSLSKSQPFWGQTNYPGGGVLLYNTSSPSVEAAAEGSSAPLLRRNV